MARSSHSAYPIRRPRSAEQSRHAGVTRPRISQVNGSKVGAFLAAHDLAVEQLVDEITGPEVDWSGIADVRGSALQLVFGAWVADDPKLRVAARYGMQVLPLHLDALGAEPSRIKRALADGFLVAADL